MVITSSRLIFREFLPQDAVSLYDLNADPDVIRFTGDKAFKSVAEAQKFLAEYDDYRVNGYGRWAMIDKTTGEFIGWCGLKYHPDSNETDVGFRLFSKYWNNGFATEAAEACVDYGFQKLRINSIIGRAMADNTASIRVLEKIGLRYEKPFDFDGRAGVIYRKYNPSKT